MVRVVGRSAVAGLGDLAVDRRRCRLLRLKPGQELGDAILLCGVLDGVSGLEPADLYVGLRQILGYTPELRYRRRRR